MIQKLNVEISISKKGIISVEYFIVYGFIQPKGDKSFEKLILQIVKRIPKYYYLNVGLLDLMA
jgi:hypothetical protein